MSKVDEEQESIRSIIEQLLILLLDREGEKKGRLSVILGAGASREYGVPTTVEMARQYFEAGLSSEFRKTLEAAEETQNISVIVERFVEEFGEQLDSDVAYAFFKNIEKDSKALITSGDVLTYDRLLHLWDQGYIKFIATTNFDKILEVRLEKRKAEGDLEAFDMVVIDYHDLDKDQRPRLVEGQLFAKLAGVIDRSNMLWTKEQFETNISKSVREWLDQAISDTPLLLLGYTASEEPLRDVLSNHKLYAASVAPHPIESIRTLSLLSAARRKPINHADTTVGTFIQLLYERLYEKTGNDSLSLSFGYVKDRVERLMQSLGEDAPQHAIISRGSVEATVVAHPDQRTKDNRLLVLLGDSGCGKSTLVFRAAQQSEKKFCLLIPAAEISRGLDNWCRRLGAADLTALCQLASRLGYGLTLFVDGLNEEAVAGHAHHILEEITALLDNINDPAIRAVVSCRTDFWNRSGLFIQRSYCPDPLVLTTFKDIELDEAIRLVETSGLQISRQPFLYEMLKLPENLGFVLELPDDATRITSEPELLTAMLIKRLRDLRFNEGSLIWVCREMRHRQAVSIDIEALDVSERRMESLNRAHDAGLLSINRFLVARFQQDRLGEFYFGREYLYSACWRDRDALSSIQAYFEDLVREYYAIEPENTAFQVLFLNALSFFLCACSDEEFREIYQLEDAFVRDMVRSSAILKRSIGFDRLYLDDPVMMALCLLRETNHERIWQAIVAVDVRFMSGLPFAFGAKLYPEAFADFIIGLIHRALKAPSDTALRLSLSPACCCVLHLGLTQGVGWMIAHHGLRSAIAKLCRNVSAPMLASRVAEVLTDNSKLLFHWHPTAKLNDIFFATPRTRESLLAATQGSVFDLATWDIVDAVKSSPSARLIMRLLFIRDYRDRRLVETLNHLFETGDLVIQDFVVGVLGFCGKSNVRLINTSADFVQRMRNEYPANFYAASLDDYEEISSQYDPLVPHATTLLSQFGEFDWTAVIPDADERSGFRIGRLAQKTILDFPVQTIDYLKSFITAYSEPDKEVLAALSIAALLFPDVYWRTMKLLGAESQSHTRPDIETIERMITQVRDYDWSKTYAFFCDPERTPDVLNPILISLLSTSTLDDWILQGITWLRSSQVE